MAVTKIKPIKSTLKKALEYIQNPDKTDDKMLVSSFGCSYETADIEFAFTLSQALDKRNNLAHHLIQSGGGSRAGPLRRGWLRWRCSLASPWVPGWGSAGATAPPGIPWP